MLISSLSLAEYRNTILGGDLSGNSMVSDDNVWHFDSYSTHGVYMGNDYGARIDVRPGLSIRVQEGTYRGQTVVLKNYLKDLIVDNSGAGSRYYSCYAYTSILEDNNGNNNFSMPDISKTIEGIGQHDHHPDYLIEYVWYKFTDKVLITKTDLDVYITQIRAHGERLGSHLGYLSIYVRTGFRPVMRYKSGKNGAWI